MLVDGPVEPLLAAALREGAQDGHDPFDRARDIIFPQTEQLHRLWAFKKACGTAPGQRAA